MKRCLALAAVLLLATQLIRAGDQPDKPLATGLKNPASVASGPGGKVYISVTAEPGKDGTGAVMVLEKGNPVPFASGLDDPRGIAAYQKSLFVVDKKRILRIDTKGKAEVFVAAEAFPQPPSNLRDLTVDPEGGKIYVSDMGTKTATTDTPGTIYSINQKKQVAVVLDPKRSPEIKRPNALVLDGQNHLLVVDSGNGTLYRVFISAGTVEKVADGFGTGDGLAWDRNGRLFISDGQSKKVFVIGRPGWAPVLLSDKFQGPADLCLDPTGKHILVADTKAGTISGLTPHTPGAEVDDTALAVEAVPAFPKLKWTNWKSETDTGKAAELRPIVLTHAGDGSNRIFVATQHGVIHILPNDPKAEKTQVFLDISERVRYFDKQNEEGLLGLAFHPQFKKNGEFFIFYSLQQGKDKHTNIISRFRVSKDDPSRADPSSEEILFKVEHKFFNHDGGTLCFGLDGYLYITTGDGGSANDPDNNGQNLKSWLAKVLRIDVDHKDPGKNYAVPKDNPFVGRDDALPEIWAYGLRNIWRMAFDRKTGTLWAGDVGQNLYEEIDIIVKGGNYGWKLREGLHPFSAKGVSQRKDLIDPIWEYHHSLGLCIIGGNVYRGKQVPEIDGAYLYADYASGKVWALRYDDKAKRVVANRPIHTPGQPILSFGEDEPGEVYFMSNTTQPSRAIFRVQQATAQPKR
jgi:glucose/arabinose dehydrogenase